MNTELQQYARNHLKTHIKLCTENQRFIFRRMYEGKNIDLTMDEVIDRMAEDKLDWAMQQVQRTIDKQR